MQTVSATTKIIEQNLIKYNRCCEKLSLPRKILLVFIGFLIGGINGLFGAGGGMLAVPALTFALGLQQKRAHATAIALILPLCAVSSVAYLANTTFDFSVIIPSAIGVTIGGVMGAALLKKMSDDFLTFLFYALMLFAGLKMIY